MWLVYGLDFSSAEAFVRIQRLLEAKNVTLVFCGGKQSINGPPPRPLLKLTLTSAPCSLPTPAAADGFVSPAYQSPSWSVPDDSLSSVPYSAVGKALQSVDLWSKSEENSYDEKGIQVFETLNAALEWTENAYLYVVLPSFKLIHLGEGADGGSIRPSGTRSTRLQPEHRRSSLLHWVSPLADGFKAIR
jgi:hypothetical protein